MARGAGWLGLASGNGVHKMNPMSAESLADSKLPQPVEATPKTPSAPHIVVIGAGFGGLWAATALSAVGVLALTGCSSDAASGSDTSTVNVVGYSVLEQANSEVIKAFTDTDAGPNAKLLIDTVFVATGAPCGAAPGPPGIFIPGIALPGAFGRGAG